MTHLTDLAIAVRKSGLRVVEIPGWQTRGRPASTGGFDPRGVLCHHTGSFDAIADAPDDLTYARWLALTGRSDLPAPLCNLALSAEGVVYVCAAGRANHAGKAQASGPMPAGDGNALYVGIEAMNSGTQGWESKGIDANGRPVTQGEAYARLCAALVQHYEWSADSVRAHKETSVTGKWDPGALDMDALRSQVRRTTLTAQKDDDMPYLDWPQKDRDALVRDVVNGLKWTDIMPGPRRLTFTAALRQLVWGREREAARQEQRPKG